MKRFLLVAAPVLGVVLFLGTVWFFYFGGQNPRLAYSIHLPGEEGERAVVRLTGPRDVAVLHRGFVALHDFVAGRKTWSVELRELEKAAATSPYLEQRRTAMTEANAKLTPLYADLQKKRTSLDPKDAAAVKAFNEEAATYAALRQKAEALNGECRALTALIDPPAATGRRERRSRDNSRWEMLPGHDRLVLIGGDRAHILSTILGKPLDVPVLLGPGARVSRSKDGLVALARIPLSNGAGAALVTTIPKAGAVTQKYIVETPLLAALSNREAAPERPSGLVADPEVETYTRRIEPQGAELLQVDVLLLERKIIERDAMRAAAKKPAKEPTSSGAAGALEILDVMENDAALASTGGKVKEDESQYEVVLQALPVDPARPPWRGKVIGRPATFRLPSVDLVATNKQLIVLDKSCRPLWEAKLTYPLAAPFMYASREMGLASGLRFEKATGENHGPCLEWGDTLYFFDLGVLAAFDLKTGKVKWRFNSVGISKLLRDGGDGLYLVSTTATPDAIRYSLESRTLKSDEQVLIKLDAQTGQEVWRVPRWVDEPFLSGDRLFGTQTAYNAMAAVGAVFSAKAGSQMTNWNLYRVSPGSGKLAGKYWQQQSALGIDFHDGKVALVFPQEVQIVHCLSLQTLTDLMP